MQRTPCNPWVDRSRPLLTGQGRDIFWLKAPPKAGRVLLGWVFYFVKGTYSLPRTPSNPPYDGGRVAKTFGTNGGVRSIDRSMSAAAQGVSSCVHFPMQHTLFCLLFPHADCCPDESFCGEGRVEACPYASCRKGILEGLLDYIT